MDCLYFYVERWSCVPSGVAACAVWSSKRRYGVKFLRCRATAVRRHTLSPLPPTHTHTHTQVRGHAVEVLRKTDDDELLYYLLQLVQASRAGPRLPLIHAATLLLL